MVDRTLLLATLFLSGCSSSSTPAPEDAGADSLANGDDGSADADSGTNDTWALYAQGFFNHYCVECHTAADPAGLDFTQYSIVFKNRSTIRCGVCVTQDPSWSCAAFPPAKQFPIDDQTKTNPKPTDAERDRIVAWIGAGAPQ